MLDEYVEDLTRQLTLRRESELKRLEAGAGSVDLARGKSQAFAVALQDVEDLRQKYTAPKITPEHLTEPPRTSYGRIGGRRVA
jgi:hypothetical protein